MKYKTIQKYIDRLNNGKGQKSIFISEISKNVSYGNVFVKRSNPALSSKHEFYFIKNNNNKYVGAVLNSGTELQWYISPMHRRKGHLTKSLKDSILPHILIKKVSINANIFDDTLSSFKSSSKVAIQCGFKLVKTENRMSYYTLFREFNI